MLFAGMVSVVCVAFGCAMLRKNINEYMFIRHMNNVQEIKRKRAALAAFTTGE